MTGNATAQSQRQSGGFQVWHLIQFCLGFIWPGMFTVLTQTFVLEITGSAADSGLVMAMIGLGAVATPIFGGLADRYQAHRPIQILSVSMVIVGILTMGFTEDEMFFVLAAILVGVGLAPAMTITTVYVVAAGLPREVEAKAIGSLQRMMFAGVILGGFAIAGLLQLQQQGQLSYAALFSICAGFAALALLLIIFATRDIAARVRELAVKRVEKANQDAPPGKFSLGDVLKSTFGLSLLVIFLNHVGWVGMAGQYVNFFDGAFGIDRSIVSSVNSIGVLASLAVIGYTGKWMGRAGPLPILSAGMVLRAVLAVALAAIGWALGGASEAIALPLLVWVAFRLVNPFIEMGNPVLTARTSVGGAAQAQAVMTAVFALAISMGNILGGQLAERFGWLALPWQTVVFCSLAFLVTYFGIRPRLQEGSNVPDPEALLTEREVAG